MTIGMFKKIFSIILLCIGVVTLLAVGRWLLKDDSLPTETPTTLPDSTSDYDSQGTDSDTDYSDTALFLQEATEMGGGFFQITPFAPDTGYPFDILYNENNNSFAVALTEEPIVESRIAVEEYLLGRLGVSLDELCQMTIFVSVPFNVNEFYAGDSLGLPSCPNSVPLE